jgi:hypothetical protein
MKKRKFVEQSNNEPTLRSDDTEQQIPSLLNWYSYNKTSTDAKNYFLDYIKQTESDELVKKISEVENLSINTSIGWLCRIFTLNENSFPQHLVNKIERAKNDVLRVVSTSNAAPSDTPNNKRPSIQDHLHKQLLVLLGELEYQMDVYLETRGSTTFSITDWLRGHTIKHYHAKSIAAHFESGLLNELTLALNKECEQMVEAYGFMTRPELKKFIAFVQTVIDECKAWESVCKQISVSNRLPRVKKPKSPLKQVAKLHYLKDHEDLKSIPPTQIVGSTQLWLYNVKTRCLAMYVSTNNHGFFVKGSTLINFDVDLSTAKVLRKPNDILPKIIAGTKITNKNVFLNIKAKQKKLTGRINKDTIIIKAL